MELQTCPHRTTEVAALGPELEDGNRGGIAFTLLFEASLRSNCEINVFNIPSGHGFMDWRDSCPGDRDMIRIHVKDWASFFFPPYFFLYLLLWYNFISTHPPLFIPHFKTTS